jgi:hypothetical protein
MGKASTTAPEAAGTVYTGTLASASSSAWVRALGRMRFSLWGTFAGVRAVLECSFDGGTTVVPCTQLGSVVEFNAPCSEVLEEIEQDVLYRVTLLAIASGTVNWRISR